MVTTTAIDYAALRDDLYALLTADQDGDAHALHAARLEAAYPGSTGRIADHLSVGRFTTDEALTWAQDPHDDAVTVVTGLWTCGRCGTEVTGTDTCPCGHLLDY